MPGHRHFRLGIFAAARAGQAAIGWRHDVPAGRRRPFPWQETGDAAGTARGLFGLSLVFQVLRRDWDAGMPYLWQAFGLAEAAEEAGDLYGRSEIHRHLGFYYFAADPRPQEAMRQLGHCCHGALGTPSRTSAKPKRSRDPPAATTALRPVGRRGYATVITTLPGWLRACWAANASRRSPRANVVLTAACSFPPSTSLASSPICAPLGSTMK